MGWITEQVDPKGNDHSERGPKKRIGMGTKEILGLLQKGLLTQFLSDMVQLFAFRFSYWKSMCLHIRPYSKPTKMPVLESLMLLRRI